MTRKVGTGEMVLMLLLLLLLLLSPVPEEGRGVVVMLDMVPLGAATIGSKMLMGLLFLLQQILRTGIIFSKALLLYKYLFFACCQNHLNVITPVERFLVTNSVHYVYREHSNSNDATHSSNVLEH